MPGLRVRVLGEFEARVGDALTLSLPARKSRALLAYLAVTGQRAERRERLAALLWGEVPEEQSRQSLRKALWHLREALAGVEPPPLSTASETIALVPETVDVLQFEALIRDGRPDALRDAVALYRGDLLEGFRIDEPAFEEWLTRERERLRRLAVEALERLLGAETVGGRVESAVEVALRLLLLNPLHEAAHRSLIGLYALQGRRDAALRQYRTCADALWRGLGVKPEPETERAYRKVLTGSTAGGSDGRPRVLLVEDEATTRKRLQQLLGHAGYHVVVAADGAEALFQLSQGSVDVVLADIWMPFLDGVKLLAIVREKRVGIPVVLITGRSDAELEASCLKMGAADYITKPFDGRALLVRLGNALRRAREANAS